MESTPGDPVTAINPKAMGTAEIIEALCGKDVHQATALRRVPRLHIKKRVWAALLQELSVAFCSHPQLK